MSRLEANPSIEVVDRFMDAFNRRDLDTFVAQLAEDAEWKDDIFPGSKGALAIRERYANLFERDVDQRLSILNRMSYGPYVIDLYNVYGRPESPFTVMFCYHVTNGKINSVWMMRENLEVPPIKDPRYMKK